MLVEEVYQLLRGYVDDPDESFMAVAKYVSALKMGYREFRQLVYRHAPEIYESYLIVPIAGVNYVGLNTVILGQTTTQARASRITRVASYESATGRDRSYYDPVGSLEQLWAAESVRGSWILQGTVLTFDRQLTDTLKIYYLPVDSVDWTGGVVTGSNKYIDDLDEYHDLIALMASRQYAIRDYAVNPVLEQQRQDRQKAFADYLTMGRNGDAYRWVQTEEGW